MKGSEKGSEQFSKIQLSKGRPFYAHIDAIKDQIGPLKIQVISGKPGQKLPSDLVLCASETHNYVTEANATWIFRQPTTMTIYPTKDQKNEAFYRLYLVFHTKTAEAQVKVKVSDQRAGKVPKFQQVFTPELEYQMNEIEEQAQKNFN